MVRLDVQQHDLFPEFVVLDIIVSLRHTTEQEFEFVL